MDTDITPGEKMLVKGQEMEELGYYPMLILTVDDVQAAAPNLTDEEALRVLDRIDRKHEWNWSEVVEIYAHMMYPKDDKDDK